MRNRIRRALSITALVSLIGLATPTAAMAATLVVDDDLVCPGAAFTTIQAAVNAANAGDTIQVCAGTYTEPSGGPLSIPPGKNNLSLEGAQAGNDARTPRGPESIITDPQGTSVGSSGVRIDGFTIRDSVVSAFTGYGVWLNPGVGGTRIANNIFRDNIVGLGLANLGSQAVISQNLFLENNVLGGASGTGIYTDEFVGGPRVENVLVTDNDFIGNANAGLDISNNAFTTAGGGVFNVEVADNDFDMNGRSMLLFNSHQWRVHDNAITNSTLPMSGAIRIFDGNSDISIMHNDLMVGAARGFRISAAPILANENIVINFNNIEDFADEGLLVEPGSHVGTVNAECNWWNASSGPTNPGNPGGTGEEAVGDADFTPWLTARAPGGRCAGGSTPGKVTGGGQLQGDPVFSPIGQLLSLPAIIVSANGSAQATFGFVIQFTAGASAPKGNLEYQDHGASVRIKATSYDFLLIDDGPCGTNTHALFTGTAKVDGETESLTVEVNDCGEPGTVGPMPDTFSIETDSYSNAGPLIGGNIQIHR